MQIPIKVAQFSKPINTRSFAKQLGLKPVTTPVTSPQSNGMAESFVKTLKRDSAKLAD
jgi:putative transposase